MSNSDFDIDELIHGCKANNRLAQEKLYRNFYSAMMMICLRYAQNEADALDILNTAFLNVFRNIHQYNSSKASLYTWIRAIVVNSSLNLLKSLQRNISSQQLTESVDIIVSPEIISKMNVAELLELLRQLPAASKAVFNMYVIDGYTHKEISTMMNITEGTSKWHLSEARKILQQKIKQTQARNEQ